MISLEVKKKIENALNVLSEMIENKKSIVMLCDFSERELSYQDAKYKTYIWVHSILGSSYHTNHTKAEWNKIMWSLERRCEEKDTNNIQIERNKSGIRGCLEALKKCLDIIKYYA